MPDVLREICQCLDRSNPIFDDDALRFWPAGERERWTALGILAETAPAQSLVCDACGHGHVECVRIVDVPNRPRRWFISCPEEGPIRVDPERLRQWAVRGDRLAGRIAEAGGFAGGMTVLEPGRVWRLGKATLGGRAVVAYLARGLGWPDAADLVARVPALRSANTVVLVPAAVPRSTIWGGSTAPPVVPLTDLLDPAEDGFRFDRDLLAGSIPNAHPTATSELIETFPTPAGTTWADLELVVEDEHLRATMGGTARRFHLSTIGFADRRKKTAPDRVWTLLRLFAEHRGVIPSCPGQAVAVPDRVKQVVLELGQRLQAIFQLDGRPIRHVSKSKEYRAGFSIASTSRPRFPTPPGAGWEDLILTELPGGRLEVTVEGIERSPAFDAASETWDQSESSTSWSRRYTLRELGLADEHDAPTPLGRALVDLLRNRGALGKSIAERDKLDLNRWLSDFFGLPDPFEIHPKTDRWVVRLTVASQVPPRGQR